MNFTVLIQTIQQTHLSLQQQATSAVNQALTIRNWLIGYYIVEFEQKGEDRAQYGEKLLKEIAASVDIKGISLTNLKLNRQFYLLYPQIGQTLSGFFKSGIGQTSDQFKKSMFQQIENAKLPGGNQKLRPRYTSADQLETTYAVNPETLVKRLSFSNLVELFEITDPLKRAFYEIEAIKGTWSVRELRRQINSLYFERSGLSKNPEKLSALVAEKAEPLQPADIIKSVYTFEFLGLKAKDVVEENDLETALLDNLHQFLLELGHGFCFEARQQKILIGSRYYFIDLVFYHRILKCHVLIDLKVEEFDHVNAGQLNTYLNYYKKEVMQTNDNPPVGILMVTNKDAALVEYATAGMDNILFVSKYLVQLPSKEQLQQFVEKELRHF